MSLALGNTRHSYNIAGGCVEFGQNRTEIQTPACSFSCNAGWTNQKCKPHRLRCSPLSSDRIGQKYDNEGGCPELGQNRTEIQRRVRRRKLRQRNTRTPTWAVAVFCNPLRACIHTQLRTDAASSDRIGQKLKRTPLPCRWPWATRGTATTLRAGASSSDRIGQKFKHRRAPSPATRVGQTRNANHIGCVVPP